MTGLANRRTFDDRFAEEQRRSSREGTPLALLMIDIDCFKNYNDTYGHQRGDDCLRRVAGTIEKTLSRAGDLAARYGGEEIVVVLPNTPNVGTVAKRIRKAIDELNIPHVGSTVSDHVTLSIGGAVAGTVAQADSLVKTADATLYLAKRKGRNQVHITRKTAEAA